MRELVTLLFGLGLFVNALLFIPQVLRIWRVKNAESVSLVTFGMFNVLQVIGALHGYFEHDWALMVGMAAALVTSGAVTALAVIYRQRAAS